MPLQKLRDKAYLVILRTADRQKTFLDESLVEMRELARAAAIRVMGELRTNLSRPNPRFFIGEGKLAELKILAKRAGANVLMFNVDLTPAQARNIEQFTGVPATDRTGLILEIFGRRARSSEGKLQVELARLNYVLPRLGGLGTVMSRLGGGIGTRGPGEQELEWDRRKIRRRIQRVKEELKKVQKHRQLIRTARKKKNFISVALVGYTNAGKTTLLNKLTGTRAHVADQMFATLDPKIGLQSINGRRDTLLVDTVGFLKELPHGLIESFHATLEEVKESDVLIHVMDASMLNIADSKAAVEQVLKEIGAAGKPTVIALNKRDLLNREREMMVHMMWPEGILVSATTGAGLDQLAAKLNQVIQSTVKSVKSIYPHSSGSSALP